jgi:hypothetical protein
MLQLGGASSGRADGLDRLSARQRRIHPGAADLPLGYFCRRELSERERRLELMTTAPGMDDILRFSESCHDFAVELRDAVAYHVVSLKW